MPNIVSSFFAESAQSSSLVSAADAASPKTESKSADANIVAFAEVLSEFGQAVDTRNQQTLLPAERVEANIALDDGEHSFTTSTPSESAAELLKSQKTFGVSLQQTPATVNPLTQLPLNSTVTSQPQSALMQVVPVNFGNSQPKTNPVISATTFVNKATNNITNHYRPIDQATSNQPRQESGFSDLATSTNRVDQSSLGSQKINPSGIHCYITHVKPSLDIESDIRPESKPASKLAAIDVPVAAIESPGISNLDGTASRIQQAVDTTVAEKSPALTKPATRYTKSVVPAPDNQVVPNQYQADRPNTFANNKSHTTYPSQLNDSFMVGAESASIPAVQSIDPGGVPARYPNQVAANQVVSTTSPIDATPLRANLISPEIEQPAAPGDFKKVEAADNPIEVQTLAQRTIARHIQPTTVDTTAITPPPPSSVRSDLATDELQTAVRSDQAQLVRPAQIQTQNMTAEIHSLPIDQSDGSNPSIINFERHTSAAPITTAIEVQSVRSASLHRAVPVDATSPDIPAAPVPLPVDEQASAVDPFVPVVNSPQNENSIQTFQRGLQQRSVVNSTDQSVTDGNQSHPVLPLDDVAERSQQFSADEQPIESVDLQPVGSKLNSTILSTPSTPATPPTQSEVDSETENSSDPASAQLDETDNANAPRVEPVLSVADVESNSKPNSYADHIPADANEQSSQDVGNHDQLKGNSIAKNETAPIFQANTKNNSVSGTVANFVRQLQQPSIDNVVRDVAESTVHQIRDLKNGESKQITLQINPKELGFLEIRVESVAEIFRAQIVASEFATTELLNREKAQLTSALQEIGIDINDIDISHRENSLANGQSDARERFANPDDATDRQREIGSADLEQKETKPSRSTSNSNLDLIA